MSFYNRKLSEERSEWVENTSGGTRHNEIFPLIKKWSNGIKDIIVDIGCGQGDCSQHIENGVHYIGIDGSGELINRANKLYGNSNKTFIQGNVYNIPLEDNSIEGVLSVRVYSHLQNIDDASKEIARILKFQGKFLIITANPESYEERKSFYKTYTIEDNLLIGDFNLGNDKQLTNTNLYLHTLSELKNALINAGLSIERSYPLGEASQNNAGLNIVFEGSKQK